MVTGMRDGPPADVPAVLRAAVLELEQHAAEAGWDQPARLYALVPTSDLVAREPRLAAAMGIDAATASGLTPVEQDTLPADRTFEDLLGTIMWPEEVAGCAAVLERLVLPADDSAPSDPEEAAEWAANHPGRQEVRMVAAVTREGERWCALRMRQHDDAASVVEGGDLVPALLELLSGTLS